VPTRHTHKWDGLHTRHLLLEREYTHTHRHKPTQNDTTTNTQPTWPDNTRAGQDPCLAGRSTSLLYVGGQGSAGPAEPEEEYEYEEYYVN
jgi:hypothetical protein